MYQSVVDRAKRSLIDAGCKIADMALSKGSPYPQYLVSKAFTGVIKQGYTKVESKCS